MPDRIMRASEVIRILGISDSTLRRMVKRGAFPAPIIISAAVQGAVGWRESVVMAYIASAQPTPRGVAEQHEAK